MKATAYEELSCLSESHSKSYSFNVHGRFHEEICNGSMVPHESAHGVSEIGKIVQKV